MIDRLELWIVVGGWSRRLCTALAMAVGAFGGACAQDTNTVAAALPGIPKSVFSLDENVPDPFFPKARLPVKVPTQTPSIPAVDLLVLRGITGPETNRVALVNNSTFKVGEEGKVRVDGDRVLVVTCVKILEKSVVVRVEGISEERELRIPERLLRTAPEAEKEQ